MFILCGFLHDVFIDFGRDCGAGLCGQNFRSCLKKMIIEVYNFNCASKVVVEFMNIYMRLAYRCWNSILKKIQIASPPSVDRLFYITHNQTLVTLIETIRDKRLEI